MFKSIVTIVAVAAIALAMPVSSHATVNACAAAKNKCVSKKAAALLKCHVRAETPPFGLAATAFDVCVQKVADKFDGGATPNKGCFAKLEAKYGAACLTSNDTDQLEDTVDSFVDDAVCQLDPGGSTCPTPCESSGYPACGGACPVGKVCSAIAFAGFGCQCVDVVGCNQSAAPTCGGYCPPILGPCRPSGGSCICPNGGL